MKKIKLNAAKLVLKKEIVGNLTNSEMKQVVGGGETGYGFCTNFTIEGFTCKTKQGPPDCGDWYNVTYGGCDTVGCQGSGVTYGCPTMPVEYGGYCKTLAITNPQFC